MQFRVDDFEAQIEDMTLAYMEWSMSRGDEGLGSLNVKAATGEVMDERRITVVDLFCQ